MDNTNWHYGQGHNNRPLSPLISNDGDHAIDDALNNTQPWNFRNQNALEMISPYGEMGLDSDSRRVQNANVQPGTHDFEPTTLGTAPHNLNVGEMLSYEPLLEGYPQFRERSAFDATCIRSYDESSPADMAKLVMDLNEADMAPQEEAIRPVHQFTGLRADAWPKALEAILMGWKKDGFTFPEISSKMQADFGIERSANVLSKRYRLILERDAEESGMMQLLKGATPKILQVLQDEMDQMGPETMDEELRREVWEELKRKLPKLVRNLAMQTRVGV